MSAVFRAPHADEARLDSLVTQLAERAGAADRNARLDPHSLQAVHDAGWLTASVGAEFGGPNVGATAFVDAFTAMGEGDPSVALIALMTHMQHIARVNGVAWPEDVYGEVLRASKERPVLLNLAGAEPARGAGSRGGAMATTARRSGSGWIVSGHKSFVTGSEHLAYHSVLLSVPDEEATARAFVPGTASGVRIEHSWEGIGMRASSTHNVVYDEVEIPDEHLVRAVPGAGSPLIGAMFGLGVSAIYLGIAIAARDALARFLNERVPTSLGAPLATVERLQSGIGEVTAHILGGSEALRSLALRVESGEDAGSARISAAKLICTRAAIAAVEEAVRLAGSHGLSTNGALERHLRNVLCARPHPPQDDISLLRLGRAALSGDFSRIPTNTEKE